LFGVGAGVEAGFGSDAELEAKVGVGAGITAEKHTGLENNDGGSVEVVVLDFEQKLLRGIVLELAREKKGRA
jgi:hypothetical protein